jgi:hypothetical protein
MAYPATFTPFNWEDLPSENTPFDKELAQEAEKRLAKFTEEYEVHWIAPVKKLSELLAIKEPNALEGDVRLVKETKRLYGWNATAKEWQPLSRWQAPVATKAALEALTDHEVGDARFVEETREVFVYLGGAWKSLVTTPQHWLAPVVKESNLPITLNVIGDVRLVEELKQFFICYKTTGAAVAEQWEPFGHVHTMEALTWVVAEKVAEGIIPGPFRKLATAETQTLIGIEVELAKGKGSNEIEYNVERWDAEGTKEWAPIASLEKLKLKKEEVKAVTVSVALHTKDRLRLHILTISSEPEGLALSAFIEHVAKVA